MLTVSESLNVHVGWRLVAAHRAGGVVLPADQILQFSGACSAMYIVHVLCCVELSCTQREALKFAITNCYTVH